MSLVLKTNKFISKIKKNPSLINELEKFAKIRLDEANNLVVIERKDEKSDVLKARDFVLALDNCVEEDVALDVLRKDFMVYLIDLRNIFQDKEDIKRILGRIIGENGKIKTKIMEITECHITITDSKILLLGSYEDIEYARHAIQIIVDGSPHTRLFKYLEKVRREKHLKQIEEFKR